MCREIDAFFMTVARETPTNKNVELGGRDGCKLFHYGVTSFMRPKSDASTVAGGFPLPDSYESFTASRLLSATKQKNGIRKRCSCYLKSIINYVIMY